MSEFFVPDCIITTLSTTTTEDDQAEGLCDDGYDVEERACGGKTTEENFVVDDPLERLAKTRARIAPLSRKP